MQIEIWIRDSDYDLQVNNLKLFQVLFYKKEWKITDEPPLGLKNNLKRSYLPFNQAGCIYNSQMGNNLDNTLEVIYD